MEVNDYMVPRDSVQTSLLERRSIRRYEREAIPEEDLRFIREAIRNTPTSHNGQQFSVIEISDQALKEQMAQISGQKQMKTCNRLFCFLSDFHKITVAAEAKHIELPGFVNTVEGLLVGTVDASLALMSAVVAATSRGLGCCPLGYARTADPDRFAELLNLPQGVYLVCALAVGVPREIPDMHPKQPLDLVVFNNRYGCDDMTGLLMEYDDTIKKYTATRSGATGEHDWIGNIVDSYREKENFSMLDALRRRGYGLDR